MTVSPASGVLVGIGEPVSLTCTASVVDHLVVSPIIEWLHPDGAIITHTQEANTSSTIHTSTLHFDSVQASDRGEYFCNVSIIIPIPSVTIPTVSSVNSTNITIGSKYTLSQSLHVHVCKQL